MNKLARSLAFALTFALTLAATVAIASEEEDVARALSAAQSWLALTDGGKFGESWDQAATPFQSAIGRSKWEQALESVRTPLGALKSRTVMTGMAAPKPAKLPVGEVIVIQFATSFQNMPAAVETVSPLREQDGSWKVSGYYIRPAPNTDPRGAAPAGGTGLSDAGIRDILRERIEVAKKGVGIVVGLVDDKGARTFSYGRMRRDNDQPVDGDSVFEIGSVTKTFTALLLADMVERGEVMLDDPISKYLPASVRTPKVDGQEITLLSLARHTSGLPRLPDNFAPKDPANPYADYTVAELYAFLNGYQSPHEIGRDFEYSNLGYGLLGHVLALRAGTDYETLLRVRVLRPLQMDSTAIVLTPEMKAHLAAGHADGKRVSNWDIPTLAGAGALRSTVRDMLKYARASLGLDQTALLPAMRRTHATSADKLRPDLEMGLGWVRSRYADADVILHAGETGGYSSFVGLDKTSRHGVVVLANSTAADSASIGRQLLEGGFSLR